MGHWLLAAFLSAQAADTATTIQLLQTRQFHEANPLLPSSVRGVLVSKVAISGGVTAIAWHYRTSHPKVSKVLLIVGTGSGTFGAVHNLTLR